MPLNIALNMPLLMVLRIKKVRALIVKLITIKIKRMFITNIFNLKIQANLFISEFLEFNFLKCKESKTNEALKSASV